MSEPNKISFARLVDWIEGRLSEEEARSVEDQVATAGEMTHAEVAWLRAFARASESVTLNSPPPEVRDELVRRFEAYAEDRRQPGFLERLIANLSFDSGPQTAVAGIRSAGSQESQRQMIYATDVVEVALDVRPRARDRHFDILGQVFPLGDEAPDAFIVQLLRGAAEFAITDTNELGEFTFEAVPPEAYEMVLSTGQIEVLISPVELSPAGASNADDKDGVPG